MKALPCILLSLVSAALHAARIEVVQDRADALYRAGEEAVFTVAVRNDEGVLLKAGKAAWALDNFGTRSIGKGNADLSSGNPFQVKGVLASEGFLRLKVNVASTSVVWSVGYDVAKIRQDEPCPADFDEYWRGEKGRLEREVPLDPRCEKDEALSAKTYDCYRVSFATFGGKRVYGFLTTPKKRKGPCRVRVTVPGAGPGAIRPQYANATEVSLVMNVHGFAPAETVQEQAKLMAAQNAALAKKYSLPNSKAYCSLAGIAESREDYWYHDVLLGINRAVDWVCTRDDVDPKRVTYYGSSQGGGFGLFLCYLNDHFTKVYVAVPALTGHYGFRQGRQDGWPKLVLSQEKSKRPVAERNAAYFDGVNFATRIRIPIRFLVGFSDMTCPPADVYAAYNACPSSDKAIENAIGSGHAWHGWYGRHRGKDCIDFDAWLRSE